MSIRMIAPLEVGIACRNLPMLRAFYEETLGFTFVSEIVVAAPAATQAALSAEGYTVVRLQTPYGERVKLLAPVAPPPPQAAPAHILERPNASYLTFIVADIDATMTSLARSGVHFLTGERRVEARAGVFLAFCHDPEGNVIELVQYDDIGAYRADLKKAGH